VDTPEWEAWQDYLKKTTGKGTATDKNFGWHFDSIWPPGYLLRQEAAAPRAAPLPASLKFDVARTIRAAKQAGPGAVELLPDGTISSLGRTGKAHAAG
jgi:hypothetical protein